MDLPNIFGAKKTAGPQRFLALDIGEEAITAGLWAVEGGKSKLLKSSSSIEWKDEVATDAAEAADVALDELGKETQELNQVVLGLQDTWVGEKGISEERKPVIKAIRDQLELKPLGFVVTTEALVQYLRVLEGGPLTGVLIEYTTANLFVSLVHAGKIERAESVGRSGDIVADLTEAFTRLKSKSLPARLLLLSRRMKHEELEAEKQLVMTHEWKESSFFLHVPKVEALPQNVFITALCVAGGTEIAAGMGLLPASETAGSDTVAVGEMKDKSAIAPPDVAEKSVAAEAAVVAAASIPAAAAPATQAAVNDFGFTEVSGEKLKDDLDQTPSTKDINISQPEPVVEPVPEPEMETVEPQSRTIKIGEDGKMIHAKPKEKKNLFAPLIDLKNKLVNTLFGGRSLAAKFGAEVSGKKRIRMLLVILGVVLVVGLVAGYAVLGATRTAEVSVTMSTVPLSKDVTIRLDPTIAQSDPELGILKVRLVEQEVSGEKERDTTGTSIVGDRATGQVTIYNATGSEKGFPAGTEITGSGGMKFTIDDDVVVASSSGSASSIQSGTVTVDVTASAIGPEYNLGANTEFTVANFDKISYVAKNGDAFSGGSKREIQAVSAADIKAIEDELSYELSEQARQKLEENALGEARTLPSNRVEVQLSSANAKAGDEVKSVKVTMTVAAAAYQYNLADLIPLIEKEFEDELGSGSIFREEQTQIEVLEILPADENEDNLPTLSVKMKTEVIPTLDRASVITSIRGTTKTQATQILNERSDVGSVEIKINPALAGLIFDKLPGDESKISLQVRVP